MKVLITFALANEFAPWRKLRRFERVSVDAWDQTYVAQIGSCDVRVVLTGAGRFATQRALAHAFDHVPDVCIASGLSGALKSDYAPGQVLAARTVADNRATRVVHCDAELVSRAEASGATIVGKFLVTDQVISTAEGKRALSASGDAVDMESLYVLAAAGQRGIRSISIRAISDAADSDLPLDFDGVFDDRGGVSIPKVIGQVVRRPSRVAGLMRLANESERAAAALARCLDAYIQQMASGPLPELAKAEALAI
jgi:adenosylhomocysteine nucleosidase